MSGEGRKVAVTAAVTPVALRAVTIFVLLVTVKLALLAVCTSNVTAPPIATFSVFGTLNVTVPPAAGQVLLTVVALPETFVMLGHTVDICAGTISDRTMPVSLFVPAFR